MAGLKLLIMPVVLFLLVGFVFATDIFKSSTPSIFNKDSPSLQQPVRYGQYRYTHYDPRVINYYRMNVHTTLEPVEEPFFERGMHPFFPKAGAKIISSRSPLLPKGQIQLTVKDLGTSAETGLAYETWLFDEQSGYALSLGVFRTTGFGNGRFEWNADLYIDEYDYVLVTEEPYPDYDPTPGPVILQGRIPKPDYFYEREFGMTDKMYGYTLT
ncbi:anti-sigma factor [Candidatus Woesearchaeota archaeon]|nr:anti-sigma factor [Candidatus Woesearchaeota archaeon]